MTERTRTKSALERQLRTGTQQNYQLNNKPKREENQHDQSKNDRVIITSDRGAVGIAADLTQILRETRKEIAKLTDKHTADTFIKQAVDMIDSDLDAEGIRMFFEGVAIICEQTNEDISNGRK